MQNQINMKEHKIIDIHVLKNKVVIYFKDQKIEINPNTYTEFNLYLNKLLSVKLDVKNGADNNI